MFYHTLMNQIKDNKNSGPCCERAKLEILKDLSIKRNSNEKVPFLEDEWESARRGPRGAVLEGLVAGN